jgi:hypothetical protein
MKKFTVLFSALSIAFLSSCSNNETDPQLSHDLRQPTSYLKSYTLKKNTSGSYYIDFDLEENSKVDSYKNTDLSNDLVISEGSNTAARSNSTALELNDDVLKVNILETNNGKKTRIIVEDDEVTKARGITEFLNNYSISKNEDDSYNLKFQVNTNVQTEFIFNEDTNTHEIHLSLGTATVQNFSRDLKMTNGRLEIGFINHKEDGASNAANRANRSLEKPNKPKIVIFYDGSSSVE